MHQPEKLKAQSIPKPEGQVQPSLTDPVKDWVAFLKRVNGDIPNGGLSQEDLRTLGEKKVNGRQIKNIVKTAGALAQGRQEQLRFDHLEQVLDLMEQFDTA